MSTRRSTDTLFPAQPVLSVVSPFVSPLVFAVLVATVFGLCIEGVQALLPDRHATPLDAFANLTVAMVVVLITAWYTRMRSDSTPST